MRPFSPFSLHLIMLLSSHSGLLPQGLWKCCFFDLKCPWPAPRNSIQLSPPQHLYLGISLISLPQKELLCPQMSSMNFSFIETITGYHIFVWSLKIIFVSLPEISPMRGAAMPTLLLVLLQQRALCLVHMSCLKIFVKWTDKKRGCDLPKGIAWACKE